MDLDELNQWMQTVKPDIDPKIMRDFIRLYALIYWINLARGISPRAWT